MLSVMFLLLAIFVVGGAFLIRDHGLGTNGFRVASRKQAELKRARRIIMSELRATEEKRDDMATFQKSYQSQPGDNLNNNNNNLDEDDNIETTEQGQAAINTINERLLAELQEAQNKEKFGSRSAGDRRFRLELLRPPKSDEEKRAAIEEARNLNGVNPVVTIIGSLVALAMAGGLWFGTNYMAEYFALHPMESDVYFIQRITSVFRNLVIGLVSLASGFFGVTGMGILFLGIRVAYGVATGELDPTPIQTKKESDDLVLPNVWDLMLNKRPTRRGKKDGNDSNNPFGI